MQDHKNLMIHVNGKSCQIGSDENTPLLWVLREELGLTGTKYGCGISACGSCAVLLNGKAVNSCAIPVKDVVNQHVTTIEGIIKDDKLHPVQEAWLELSVPECGYCQSGQIINAISILENERALTTENVEHAMSKVLCRCGTYQKIRNAINLAAIKLEKKIDG